MESMKHLKEEIMQAVAHFVETFVPEHYEVFLDLSRKIKTFSGRVVITEMCIRDRWKYRFF